MIHTKTIAFPVVFYFEHNTDVYLLPVLLSLKFGNYSVEWGWDKHVLMTSLIWSSDSSIWGQNKSDRMESFKKWSHLENYFKLIYPIISCSIGVMIHIDIRVWRYEKMQRSQNMINIWNYCWINLSVLQETICKFVLIRKKNEGRYYLPNQWMKWGNCNLNDSI